MDDQLQNGEKVVLIHTDRNRIITEKDSVSEKAEDKNRRERCRVKSHIIFRSSPNIYHPAQNCFISVVVCVCVCFVRVISPLPNAKRQRIIKTQKKISKFTLIIAVKRFLSSLSEPEPYSIATVRFRARALSLSHVFFSFLKLKISPTLNPLLRVGLLLSFSQESAQKGLR